MKKILFIAAMLLSISVSAQKINSFYDFTVKDINGDDFPLSQLKGKKVLLLIQLLNADSHLNTKILKNYIKPTVTGTLLLSVSLPTIF